MNEKIEQEVVKEFVHKSERDRVLFELSSPKRRSECISRIWEKIDRKYMTDITKGFCSYEQVWNIFKDLGAKPNDDCYLLYDDGEILPLKETLEKYVFKGFLLIYWPKGKVAFLGGEMFTYHGTAIPKFILKRKY